MEFVYSGEWFYVGNTGVNFEFFFKHVEWRHDLFHKCYPVSETYLGQHFGNGFNTSHEKTFFLYWLLHLLILEFESIMSKVIKPRSYII